jgi:hypothetical protein
MSFLSSLAAALLLTILTEFAVYLLLLRESPQKLLLYSILINSFTNPLFNYLYNFEIHQLYPLEMGVALIESFLIMLLAEVSYPRALLVSLAANLASLAVGLLIFG